MEILEQKLKLELTQLSVLIIDSPIEKIISSEKDRILARNLIADRFFDQFKVARVMYCFDG